MLRIYSCQNNHLAVIDAIPELSDITPVVWFDLFNPAQDETRIVEQQLGIEIPTRDEMQEIELSDRLYQEDGAEFMTMTAATELDGDNPIKVPVTFILKGATLVTVRHADPKPFHLYAARMQRLNGVSCESGELVMLGLLEAMIDRTADALERIGNEIDGISREVFRKNHSSVTKKTRDLQSLIEQIGQKGDFLSVIRESLVSVGRLVAYHTALDGIGTRKAIKESRQRIKLIQRDAASLGDHALFFVEQDQFPARCDARPDQSGAEPDHQDLLGRLRRLPAANTCCLDLRHELRCHAGTEIRLRLSAGPVHDGAVGSVAVPLFQAARLALTGIFAPVSLAIFQILRHPRPCGGDIVAARTRRKRL